MKDRREFSKATKLAAWQRSGGICECGCGVKIISGDGPEYDHRIEDMLDGGNDVDNCVVLRKRCHDRKTKERRPEIDKVRRGFENRIKARDRRGKPMPGTKASGWKHKIDGGWERR